MSYPVIPLSEREWNLLKSRTNFKEYESKIVAGVTLNLVSCDLVPTHCFVFVQPMFDKPEGV